jgi:hypothetical protein
MGVLTLGGKITFGRVLLRLRQTVLLLLTSEQQTLLSCLQRLVIYIIKTILPIRDLATGTGTMIGFDNEGPEDTGNNDHTIGELFMLKKL